jgi:hypothetical protein
MRKLPPPPTDYQLLIAVSVVLGTIWLVADWSYFSQPWIWGPWAVGTVVYLIVLAAAFFWYRRR